jgi:hypothetical protein
MKTIIPTEHWNICCECFDKYVIANIEFAWLNHGVSR